LAGKIKAASKQKNIIHRFGDGAAQQCGYFIDLQRVD
jgi:hypothetical protein